MRKLSIVIAVVAVANSLALSARAVIVQTDSGLIAATGASNADIVSDWESANAGNPPVNTSADLLLNHLSGAPTLVGDMAFSSSLAAINDGLMVSSLGGSPDNFTDTGNDAVFDTFPAGSNVPNVLTFHLDGSYNLTTIDSFGAYDLSRLGQNYTVGISSDGGATFSPLTTVNFANFPGTGADYVRGIDIANSTSGAIIAANVNALQFTFNTPADGSGAAVYSEIAAYGTLATPEPATNVLLSVGALGLGLVARRRRTRVAG